MKSKEFATPCNPTTRREFLRLAALAGGVALIGGCGGSSPDSSTASSASGLGSTYNPIRAIPQEDSSLLVPGGGKLTAGNAFAFVNERNIPGILYATKEGELKAISALCTHQGCTVRWRGIDTPLICPCHGSEFTLSGESLKGPAVDPLPIYKARKQGDDAIVSL